MSRRLRAEAVAQFVRKASEREVVWILQGAEGPACLMSKRRPGAQMLPCWYDRAHAEARIAGPLADCVAAAVPLATFRDRTLLWLGELGPAGGARLLRGRRRRSSWRLPTLPRDWPAPRNPQATAA